MRSERRETSKIRIPCTSPSVPGTRGVDVHRRQTRKPNELHENEAKKSNTRDQRTGHANPAPRPPNRPRNQLPFDVSYCSQASDVQATTRHVTTIDSPGVWRQAHSTTAHTTHRKQPRKLPKPKSIGDTGTSTSRVRPNHQAREPPVDAFTVPVRGRSDGSALRGGALKVSEVETPSPSQQSRHPKWGGERWLENSVGETRHLEPESRTGGHSSTVSASDRRKHNT